MPSAWFVELTGNLKIHIDGNRVYQALAKATDENLSRKLSDWTSMKSVFSQLDAIGWSENSPKSDCNA
jgi:hypothetical protein